VHIVARTAIATRRTGECTLHIPIYIELGATTWTIARLERFEGKWAIQYHESSLDGQ